MNENSIAYRNFIEKLTLIVTEKYLEKNNLDSNILHADVVYWMSEDIMKLVKQMDETYNNTFGGSYDEDNE